MSAIAECPYCHLDSLTVEVCEYPGCTPSETKQLRCICGYKSIEMPTRRRAIEMHNRLCARLDAGRDMAESLGAIKAEIAKRKTIDASVECMRLNNSYEQERKAMKSAMEASERYHRAATSPEVPR